MQCCKEYKEYFKDNKQIMEKIDIQICNIIYSVSRAFFKYLVCNIKDTLFTNEHYPDFFISVLKHFIEIFSTKKYIFNDVVKILRAKEAKLIQDRCTSLLPYDQ